jgi:hypothetical protein
MNLTKLIVYGLLGLVMLVGIVSTVWTVIPDSTTKTVSDLGKAWGYTTHCPIAPYSTYASIAVTIIAAIILLLAWRLWK